MAEHARATSLVYKIFPGSCPVQGSQHFSPIATLVSDMKTTYSELLSISCIVFIHLYSAPHSMSLSAMGGDLASNLGGTKQFFRGPISGKISTIFRVKISDDLFFSHRPGSSDFFFLFPHLFRMFTMLNVVYMTISSQEKHNFSLCSCFHAHPPTLLLKILGGFQCMGGPPTSNFGATVPPVPPRSPPLALRNVPQLPVVDFPHSAFYPYPGIMPVGLFHPMTQTSLLCYVSDRPDFNASILLLAHLSGISYY